MKKPWLTFTGICALVFGIVVFCVIIGGYSSFLRSQNRIEAVKLHLVDQCLDQLDQVNHLVSLSRSTDDPKLSDPISVAAKQARIVLDKINHSQNALSLELINEFETTQTRLNREIMAMTNEIKMSEEKVSETFLNIEKKIKELETNIMIMTKKYNKEAQYFNTRTHVFPGFIIARLFDLDTINFQELPVQTSFNQKASDNDA